MTRPSFPFECRQNFILNMSAVLRKGRVDKNNPHRRTGWFIFFVVKVRIVRLFGVRAYECSKQKTKLNSSFCIRHLTPPDNKAIIKKSPLQKNQDSRGKNCRFTFFRNKGPKDTKVPFTQVISVAQLDAIFFRALSCSFKIARVNHLRFCRRDIADLSNMFETWGNSERDKNWIELRDKNRLCKRGLKHLLPPTLNAATTLSPWAHARLI